MSSKGLFLSLFAIIYFIFSLSSGCAYINVIAESRLVNFTLTLRIFNPANAYGNLQIWTNKLPLNCSYHFCDELNRNITLLINKTEQYYNQSAILQLISKPLFDSIVQWDDVKTNITIRNVKLDDFTEICYDNFCGKKDDVLDYIASQFMTDDPFKSICKINHFVHEFITYDESYAEDQNPTIIRIFNIRRGVCVHYATLFNELMQAIGVKSKIVYGYAKSSENDTMWNAHAWNEVWLGEWIPFDPTFDFCGIYDSFHIKMSEEPLKSSILFMPRKNVNEIQFEDEIIIKEINKSKTNFGFNISYDIEFEVDKVSFNSYQLMYLIVKNNEPYYVFANLNYITPKDVVVNGTDFIVLKPYEKQILPVLIYPKLKSSSRYYYSVPISVYDCWENSVSGSFLVDSSGVDLNEKVKKVHKKDVVYNFTIFCENKVFFVSDEFWVKNDLGCYIHNFGSPFADILNITLSSGNYLMSLNKSVFLGYDDNDALLFDSVVDVFWKNYLHKNVNNTIEIIFDLKNQSFNFSFLILPFPCKMIDDGNCIKTENCNVSFIIKDSQFNNLLFKEQLLKPINSMLCRNDIINTFYIYQPRNVSVFANVIYSNDNYQVLGNKTLFLELNPDTKTRLLNRVKYFFKVLDFYFNYFVDFFLAQT